MPSLNARFAENGGRPIRFGGQTVHIAYKRNISAGDQFSVEFLRRSAERDQGVNLRARKGQLMVNDVRSSAISLWVETAPPIVEVACLRTPRDGLLLVSNQWRRPDGVEDEWTNNAGIIVEDRGAIVYLHCSDGVGEPNFNDLVLKLEFWKPAKGFP
jgi:hypothetical protein